MGKALGQMGGGGSPQIEIEIGHSGVNWIATENPLSVSRFQMVGAMDGNGNTLLIGGASYHAPSSQTGVQIDRTNVDRLDQVGGITQLANTFGAKPYYAATDGNGAVLVMDNATCAVERYDLHGVHETLTPLPALRYEMTMQADGNGMVFVAGGLTSGYYNTVSEVYRYDTEGVRTTMPNLPYAPAYATGCTWNGRAVLVGGAGVYNSNTSYQSVIYGIDTQGGAKYLGSLNYALRAVGVAVDGNNRLVCAGGWNNSYQQGRNSVDCYDTEGVRTAMTPMIPARAEKCVGASLADGSVIFMGGTTGTAVDCYDTEGVHSIYEAPTLREGGTVAQTRYANLTPNGNGLAVMSGMRAEPYTTAMNTMNILFFLGNGKQGLRRFDIPANASYKLRYDDVEKHSGPDGHKQIIMTPNEGYVRLGKMGRMVFG